MLAQSLLLIAVVGQTAALPHLVFNLIDDFGWANVGWHRNAGFNETVTPNMDALVASGVELDQYYVHKYCSPSRSSYQSGRACPTRPPRDRNAYHIIPALSPACRLPVPRECVQLRHVHAQRQRPRVGLRRRAYHCKLNNSVRLATCRTLTRNPARPKQVPRNMTGIATKLKSAGYATHMVVRARARPRASARDTNRTRPLPSLSPRPLTQGKWDAGASSRAACARS